MVTNTTVPTDDGRLPHLDEVSIGHALIGHAVFEGLTNVVREYLDVLRTPS